MHKQRRKARKPHQDPRCKARDARGQRCEIRGEHRQIINSKGQRALSHMTEFSMWSTPIHDLQVATAFSPDPQLLAAMLDRARHATADDVAAGGANNEEELLACLRLGFVRAMEGHDPNNPGENTLGFTMWPNGQKAFACGWNYACELQAEHQAALEKAGE